MYAVVQKCKNIKKITIKISFFSNVFKNFLKLIKKINNSKNLVFIFKIIILYENNRVLSISRENQIVHKIQIVIHFLIKELQFDE